MDVKTLRTWFAAVAVGLGIACTKDDGGAPPADAGADATGDVTCPRGYGDCDGNPKTLCETNLTSDPASCGACGNACPPGVAHQIARCAAGACTLACEPGFVDCDGDPKNGCEQTDSLCGVTVLASYTAPGGLAVDDDYVYYASKGKTPDFLDGVVYRVSKKGGAPTVLATGLNRPLNLALDATRLYVTNGGHLDQTDGSILSVAKDGSDPIVLASALLRPNNPVVVGDLLYFTTREQPAGAIHSIRKDGADPAIALVVPSVVNANDLARAGDAIVWAASGAAADGGQALVERAALDGGARLTLATGIPSPSYQLGVAADALYVGSLADGEIRRVPLVGGGPPTTIATGLGETQEAIFDGAWIYAANGSARRVVAIPVAGGAPVVLADHQRFPSYLAMDADGVYFTDGPLSDAATIRRVKKPAR